MWLNREKFLKEEKILENLNRRLEQFMKFVDWMRFTRFSIIFQLKDEVLLFPKISLDLIVRSSFFIIMGQLTEIWSLQIYESNKH